MQRALVAGFVVLASGRKSHSHEEYREYSTDRVDRLHHEILPYDPNPNPDSVIFSTDGRMRFTVLTDMLVRIERDGVDDRPSLSAVNRNLPAPRFSVERHADGLRIATDAIELYYREESSHLKGSSLQAVNKVTQQTWQFGDYPSGNLFGTIRTLDWLGPTNLNCSTFIDPDAHCEFGLISTDGWAILDDSKSPRLAGPNDWWDGDARQDIDMYLFMHGRAFKEAIADYAKIGGSVPLPPRSMLGILWTRWFDYDSVDLKSLVSGFSVRGLPLDMLIVDMNWHIKPWWGGYSFDERIIPDPRALFDWIHDRGVSVSLNVHDCLLAEPGCPSGTITSDDTDIFEEYVRMVGLNLPSHNTTIPLDLLNETLALAKEDAAFRRFENLSDAWWIDWQQGDTGPGGLQGGKQNPTIWINKLRYTNRQRWGLNERGAVLARFGGMGSHRYGIGFSGDVQMLDWENLAYQPFFTATAANVLFSSWSHDVTGPNRDPELLVRWTQWAAFSPMLRFHERGMSSGPCAYATFPLPSKECANVDLWANLPGRFADSVRLAMLYRTKLVPYIYTETHKTFSSGIPWFRPLYFDFPDHPLAYSQESQYIFGDDITVAPVVNRSDVTSPTTTAWSIWAPPGLWYSPMDGALVNGGTDGTLYTRKWDMDEIPLLVKAGTLLATRYVDPTRGSQKLVGLAHTDNTDIVFEVIPGADRGETALFEDDGRTVDYVTGKNVGFLRASYERLADGSITLRVRAEGPYSLSVKNRRIHFRLLDSSPVVRASATTHSKPHMRYDGTTLEADVFVDWDLGIDGDEIVITAEPAVANMDLSGMKGGIAHARYAKAALDEAVLTPGTHPCWHGMPCGYQPDDFNLISTAVVGERLTSATTAKEFEDIVLKFVREYKESVDREITVENVLRVDTLWAPTQGGWPEAARWRVNYAIDSVQAAMHKVCQANPLVIMPLACKKEQAHKERIHSIVPMGERRRRLKKPQSYEGPSGSAEIPAEHTH